LGLLASGVSLAYTEAIQLAERCFQGKVRGFAWLGRLPRPLHPIVGGAAVGLVALQLPQILGIGYETVQAMLQDVKFSLPLLLQLLFVKLAMTAISLGSGLVGGIFAPAMFLGASLGSAYGLFLEMLPAMSDRVAGPAAYAMVGMAAVLAGSARAPLTAILLMFELTRDYRIVLPLMAAVGLSVWLVEFVNRRSTAHSLNLQQMGVDVAVNTPIKAREQLQDWEDVLGDRIVTELISCPIPIDEEHSDDEPVLASANAHLPENVKPLPETKSAVGPRSNPVGSSQNQ
jgi:H+/Cl- antiporter ClcA